MIPLLQKEIDDEEIIRSVARMAAEVESEAGSVVDEWFDFFENCIHEIGCEWFPVGMTTSEIRPIFNRIAMEFYKKEKEL